MSDKDLAMETLCRLPEDIQLSQIIKRKIVAAIERGRQAADRGDVISHEELKLRSASWPVK